VATEIKASFIDALSGIRKGAFVTLVDEKLTDLVAAVAQHDADGEITVTLSLKANGEGQVVIRPKVKAKIPHRPVGDAIFYATTEGELERTDPRQGDFEFDQLKN
jgi:hypothetical protein